MPADALLSGDRERSDVGLRSARERRIPVGAGMHRREHAGRSAHVVGVGVGQDEGVERATTPEDVREDGRATRIAAAPRRTRVEQYPVAAVRSNQDCVALPYVEHVQLDAIAA